MANTLRRSDTDVTRWVPGSELENLNALMNRFLEGWGEVAPLIEEGFVPAADVEETDEGFVIEVELPGVDKGDIDVSISGRRITITGERKEKERKGVLRRRVRSTGRFRYEVLLPGDVDEDSVAASLDSGVLTVRVAKRSGDKLRHIAVK